MTDYNLKCLVDEHVNKEIKYGRRFSLEFSKPRFSKILTGKIAYIGLENFVHRFALLFIHSPILIFNTLYIILNNTYYYNKRYTHFLTVAFVFAI